MTNREILDKVMDSHPCFPVNGVKSYTYLETYRMIEEALTLKDKEI